MNSVVLISLIYTDYVKKRTKEEKKKNNVYFFKVFEMFNILLTGCEFISYLERHTAL